MIALLKFIISLQTTDFLQIYRYLYICTYLYSGSYSSNSSSSFLSNSSILIFSFGLTFFGFAFGILAISGFGLATRLVMSKCLHIVLVSFNWYFTSFILSGSISKAT